MKYEFNFAELLPYWPQFLHGAWLTLQMAVLSIALGLVAGVLLAIGRRGSVGWISKLCGAYIETVRNTPFLIQIFFLYFGLASTGLRLPVFFAAVIAMMLNVAAYTAEIVRAGMDATPRGQIEAAEALGMNGAQIYWYVILLPAIERVYPALTSQFVLMLLMTSVTSQISAEELTAIANNIQSQTFRSFETYIVVALLYIVLVALLRTSFWGAGLLLFPHKRMLAR